MLAPCHGTIELPKGCDQIYQLIDPGFILQHIKASQMAITITTVSNSGTKDVPAATTCH
jgi:hypothetical protein